MINRYPKKKERIKLCLIGGEDISLRIPFILSLKKMGFSIIVIGSESEKIFKKYNIKYNNFYLNRNVSPIDDIRSLYELIKLLKNSKIDIVHAFDTKPTYLAPIAGKIAGIPVIIRTITGMGQIFSCNNNLTTILKIIYRFTQKIGSILSDITIFQNKNDSEYFVKNNIVPKNKQKIIYSSGVDLKKYNKNIVNPRKMESLRNKFKLHNKIVVLLISRLIEQKGIKEYLEAADFLKGKYKNLSFLLAGPLCNETKLGISKALINRYSDAVNYLGSFSDVRELYALANIFVLPSYYSEGIPRVLLEAGAFELATVTTNRPGCKDVIKNGKNGLLVKPKDKTSLVNAINSLIINSERREKMGRMNKIYIKRNFELKKVSKKHEKIYKNCLITNGIAN